MNPIAEYLIATLAFALLGAWLFLLFRWWFQHLSALAVRYDVVQRRKMAARRYLIVMAFVAVPTLTVLLSIINRTSVSSLFILIGFALAATPAMIWWCPRMASLKSLGYGRQPRSKQAPRMSNGELVSCLRALPFLLAVAAPFLGMHLFRLSAKHNLLWECLYGLGYFVSGFFLHPYALNRSIWFICSVLWPLIVSTFVFFVARRVICASRQLRIITATALLGSLSLWVSDDRANALAENYWPIFCNYYATNF
jgi:hypothetical protein